MPDSDFSPLPFAAGLALAGAAALAVDAFLIEPACVEVTRHRLPVPELPPEWEGACLVHLTDLHYGDPRSDRLFEWMVRTVNAMEPALIVITGDFLYRARPTVRPCAAYLARLRSRHGIVATLGDHDFDLETGEVAPGLIEALEGIGIRLLRNQALELPGGLCIAGIEPNTRKLDVADLDAALAEVPGSVPHLLLAHSPDVLPEAVARNLPAVLCGHTHGGQVVLPFFGPPITHTRVHREHAAGWSRVGKTRLYTGRGLASHFSLRFLCRPEIAVFTLGSAPRPLAPAAEAGKG